VPQGACSSSSKACQGMGGGMMNSMGQQGMGMQQPLTTLAQQRMQQQRLQQMQRQGPEGTEEGLV